MEKRGLYLGFKPISSKDGQTVSFDLYLIHLGGYPMVYTLHLYNQGGFSLKKNEKLEPQTFERIGNVPFDWLNDQPGADIEIFPIFTSGKGEKQSQKVKIKPKSFFSKKGSLPLLHVTGFPILLIQEKMNPDQKEEELSSYTKRKARPQRQSIQDQDLPVYSTIDAQAFAGFPLEIDLHVEALQTGSHKKVKAADALRLQLAAFESYIEDAIRLGISRVFVIHGVGKGKLKERIFAYLFQHPNVSTFRNEFHPKYGFGATEVIFE